MEGVEPPRAAGRHNILTVAWIIYGTLALLLLSLPNQVAGRLDDLPSTGLVRGVQQATLVIAKASDSVRIQPIYKDLRTRFLTLAGLGGS